ncbi:J domain-containing protein [Sulfuriferula multivorans]|uniref:J domain-containing protein n=1 Tax=Sulfuriferula multivorans TaxID=1559896 RepID=UPI000F5BC930|nr:J domain-containing protein [Sulfuriferula multivorans]
MARTRTHYDNLQVSQLASAEVIRASYRVLSQKYHPDKCEVGKLLAESRMKIINEAYAVLSDPEKRRSHDVWIAEAIKQEPKPETKFEPKVSAEVCSPYSPPVKMAAAKVFRTNSQPVNDGVTLGGFMRGLFGLGFVILLMYLFAAMVIG